jgi:hypothetical protein
MKTLILSSLLFLSVQASAVHKLVCVPGYEEMRKDAVIEVTFTYNIDPLKPFVGRYEMGAELKFKDLVTHQLYTRPDLVMRPESGTADVSMRGGAAGMVHLRLSPVIKNGAFTGRYTGDLFINDLNVRAYYNLVGTSKEPGILCEAR